ncbi:hypothetical protein B8T70_22280 [Flavobacterium sp. AJR]|nr:hypothetical protein B8T70_22280 [Flavobacterium sp. AJR]
MLMFPSFGNVLVYAMFKINQDKIAKTICVQRKVEFNSCNGKCQLKKNLLKLDANEKEMQNHLKEKQELVYIQNFNSDDIFDKKYKENHLAAFFYFTKKPISVSIMTFRPPAYFI